MFTALAALEVPWHEVTIWQVDERVAPDGDPGRNAGQLDALDGHVELMPVTATDLAEAAARYGQGLPDRFDVVHLGLGDDGHTASWPPHHDVISSVRPVETIGEFNGYQRMTMTPPVVNGARCRVMLTLGLGKAAMVERWLLQDPELPVTKLRRADTIVFLDPNAASLLPL
jgi:6-phosphogluconolactonase/glucosamine-6-phosphate isomerase/deaminase